MRNYHQWKAMMLHAEMVSHGANHMAVLSNSNLTVCCLM